MQILKPLVVTRIKAVFPEHFELAACQLFCLFELHRVKLHGIVVLLVVEGLLRLLSEVLPTLGLLVGRFLLSTALLLLGPILLRDFIFHDVD
jgi:hypothetical protein